MAPRTTWQSLLGAQSVRVHKTGPEELGDLRAVVTRDLNDSKLSGLSADRRFATAYNAILQLTKIVIACEGYRVSGLGHHQTTFKALELAMGTQVAGLVPYFDQCRKKRNRLDYDSANVATESEVDDIIRKAE